MSRLSRPPIDPRRSRHAGRSPRSVDRSTRLDPSRRFPSRQGRHLQHSTSRSTPGPSPRSPTRPIARQRGHSGRQGTSGSSTRS
jgi:hypothetical protein